MTNERNRKVQKLRTEKRNGLTHLNGKDRKTKRQKGRKTEDFDALTGKND